MNQIQSKRLAFAILVLAGFPILMGVVLIWVHDQRAKAEAVRIAARAYQQEFGEPPPPYRQLSPKSVAHLQVEWQSARGVYVVRFGRQYVASDTPRDLLLGRPIPFRSATTMTSFEVTPEGRCVYVGMHAAGPF